MNAHPPSRCPVCTRDLTPLPLPNTCPECGFEYDAETRIWRSSESWARLALVYAAVALALGLFIAVTQRVGFGQALSPTLPLVGVLVGPAVGLLFRRVIGGRISGRFVAITPRGILVGTRGRPTLVPWADFGQLRERHGVPKIRLRDSGDLIAIDDIFASPEELAEFRAALTAAVRRNRRPTGQ